MPSSIIVPHGKKNDVIAQQRTETFTGQVWSYGVITDGEVAAGNVAFMPGARTHWHTHEKGQMIQVTGGSGWICDKGDKPREIKTGDIIWAEPGATHWHGAEKECFMTHSVVAIGKTTWHGKVTDEEYGG